MIIVDLLACVSQMYKDLDPICGGQARVYRKRWEKFISGFESAGIELVFVTDGPQKESKRKTWVERRYQTLEKFVFPVFDSLVIFFLLVIERK